MGTMNAKDRPQTERNLGNEIPVFRVDPLLLVSRKPVPYEPVRVLLGFDDSGERKQVHWLISEIRVRGDCVVFDQNLRN
jgi:hypothetical protein